MTLKQPERSSVWTEALMSGAAGAQSEQQETRLAETITKDVMNIFDCGEDAVSVAMEEINPPDWAEKIYKPDIFDQPEKI